MQDSPYNNNKGINGFPSEATTKRRQAQPHQAGSKLVVECIARHTHHNSNIIANTRVPMKNNRTLNKNTIIH